MANCRDGETSGWQIVIVWRTVAVDKGTHHQRNTMRPYLHQQIRAFSNKLVSLIRVFQILSESRISETSTVFRWFDLRISETTKKCGFADTQIRWFAALRFLFALNQSILKALFLLGNQEMLTPLVSVPCLFHCGTTAGFVWKSTAAPLQFKLAKFPVTFSNWST